jgi:hypothetical protein
MSKSKDSELTAGGLEEVCFPSFLQGAIPKQIVTINNKNHMGRIYI